MFSFFISYSFIGGRGGLTADRPMEHRKIVRDPSEPDNNQGPPVKTKGGPD